MGCATGFLPTRGPARVAALSSAFAVCLVLGQFAPAMMGVAAIPWLGFLLAAKPSIGLALFAAHPSLRTLISGIALVAVSLAILPDWPLRWLEALQTMPQHAPIVMPKAIAASTAISPAQPVRVATATAKRCSRRMTAEG